ncbi:MAG: ABC transporter ATP-binding protein [Bacilli bacterium]|jgi:putative ABC transport system permease protein|nr:ABC transporter ATP-binding protein [Bacilli bacterium]NCA94793.1 ABC transporter ATP-binding protein [Campylobacterota bacterium]NLB40169.1 ABC transporter ATP-binding protein [Erysipelotrichaceae bacterium]
METPILKIDNLSRVFSLGGQDYPVLQNIDLAFEERGFVLLSGKSGSGKSTLLNLIAGILKPSHGHVLYKNKTIDGMNEKHICAYRNREIGFVFQQYNLFDKQSVLFNVVLPLLIDGRGISKCYEMGRKLLSAYKLDLMHDTEVGKLSGGEKQRVAILRAIINDPAIVLADEPTGALDRENAIKTLEMLKAISKERLVIVVSHNLDLALAYATRHIEVKDGQIVSDVSFPEQS